MSSHFQFLGISQHVMLYAISIRYFANFDHLCQCVVSLPYMYAADNNLAVKYYLSPGFRFYNIL